MTERVDLGTHLLQGFVDELEVAGRHRFLPFEEDFHFDAEGFRPARGPVNSEFALTDSVADG